ncbi:hypothetical protein ALP43_04661, partial [Pseudomonas azotoformans]
MPSPAEPVARHIGLGHRDPDFLSDLLDGADQLQDRNRRVRHAAAVHLHADAGELPAHQRAQQLLRLRLELGGDFVQRHRPVPAHFGTGRLFHGVLRNPAHQGHAALDAVDQNAAAGGRADADLPVGQELWPVGHAHCADHHLHPDQPADCGVDGVHLLQGHPQGHPRSRPPGRRHPVAGNGARAAAHRQGWPGLHGTAVVDPVLERGLLVAEPDLLQRRAVDRLDRLLLQPRRLVLGQAVRRLDPRLRADPDLWLDQPEAVGTRFVLWRRQIIIPSGGPIMANLKIKNLQKGFEGFSIIKGIDLEVNDKEFVVFVGPSGCGKSTLLRLIAGLEEVSDGTIELDGRDITEVTPAKRDLAMVFQTYALYPHMSVRKNMSFALDLAGVDKQLVESKVSEAARILELGPLLERKPKQLSGGQRQRVAIGRAIVRNPKIFLFDEPLSNLDAALRVQMRLELARLHKELQATMIYVTHDQVEAMTLADKVVVLNSGRIEQVGSPLELYHQPANLFVAGFLGTPKMGFLKGQVTRVDSQGCEVQLDAGTLISLPLSGATLSVGSAVTLGIRPEHLEMATPGQTTLTVTADVG